MGVAPEAGTILAVTWGGPARLDLLLAPLAGPPPARLVAVDPAAAGTPALPPGWAGAVAVEPVRGVLAAGAGEARLLRHSLPGLVSRQPATPALYGILPGLRETGRLAAPQIPVADLAGRLGEGPLLVLLETPGAEIETLDLLEAAGLLPRIAGLRLRCGSEPWFVGAPDEAGIRVWLERRCFRLETRAADDAEWPELAFAADPQQRRIAELEALLAEAGAAAAVRDAALDARDAALAVAQDGLTRALAEARAAAAALGQALAGHDAALAGARAAALAAEERLARLAGAEARARDDLGLALAALRAAQGDLADLRTRHAALHDEKERLLDLIRQLTPRLQEAAGRLRLMPGTAP